MYTGDISTKTANLSTVKILFISIISMPKAKCMMGDLKDFYLGTPMDPKDYAYMCIPVHMLPNNIIQHYNLALLIHNGMSMSRSNMVCMSCHKPDYSPTYSYSTS